METQPRKISIIEPVAAAIEETQKILFRPFDLSKWFAIGFGAWLATLGEGGGGNFNYSGGGGGGGGGGTGTGDFQQEFHSFKEEMLANLPLILSIVIGVALVVIVLVVVFTWLRSRGQFMFLHCVAHNKGEVVYPWKRYARQANSLFRFRLLLGSSFAIIALALATPLFFIMKPLIQSEFKTITPTPIITAVLIGLVFAVVALVFGVIKTLTIDFVVPVMFVNGDTVTEGWRRFWKLAKANLSEFILYLLFIIVVGLALGAMTMMIIMGSCCMCGIGIIFMIPYIGTVALLPLLVWRRAYSAIFFAQFGPRFNVFPPPENEIAPSMMNPPTAPTDPPAPINPYPNTPTTPPEQNF